MSQPIGNRDGSSDGAAKPPQRNEREGALALDRRCAFLGIDETDLERVRGLETLFRGLYDDFVERFYGHLLSHPETAAFLTDPERVARLKRSQQQYFDDLLRSRIDAGYAVDRQRIGQVHAEVGLEPQWFIGAFNQYVQYYFRQFATDCERDLDRYVEGTLSLIKVLLLDVGLALDSYFAQSTEQLRTALDLLAQSNAGLKEFARLASHDLKTPLGTVAGYCDEFLDEFGASVPQEGRALIEAARARAIQLGQTIGDLLAISEANAQPDARFEISTRRVLDEVLERLRPEVDDRAIQIDVPDALPNVVMHPGRLHEVFYNLLSNAIKYMDKDEGVIRLDVDSLGSECVFRVSDNGPGIPETELKSIFAPFRRLPQHRNRPGSGLGLHFVRTFVEEQRGRVWVESTPGEGSRFFVALQARV